MINFQSYIMYSTLLRKKYKFQPLKIIKVYIFFIMIVYVYCIKLAYQLRSTFQLMKIVLLNSIDIKYLIQYLKVRVLIF